MRNSRPQKSAHDGAHEGALAPHAMIGILLTLTTACGGGPTPRASLPAPEPEIRYVALRSAPQQGAAAMRTIPRAVAATGSRDHGLEQACVRLLLDTPALRQSEDAVICEEVARPGSGSSVDALPDTQLTSLQDLKLSPLGTIWRVEHPSTMSESDLQSLATGRTSPRP